MERVINSVVIFWSITVTITIDRRWHCCLLFAMLSRRLYRSAESSFLSLLYIAYCRIPYLFVFSGTDFSLKNKFSIFSKNINIWDIILSWTNYSGYFTTFFPHFIPISLRRIHCLLVQLSDRRRVSSLNNFFSPQHLCCTFPFQLLFVLQTHRLVVRCELDENTKFASVFFVQKKKIFIEISQRSKSGSLNELSIIDNLLIICRLLICYQFSVY